MASKLSGPKNRARGLRLYTIAAEPRLCTPARPPLHYAFVPHASYLIIGSNFCQGLVGGPNPSPGNFLNREISETQSALGERSGFFAYFAVLYRRIVQFQQDFCRKGTQRTQRQGLMQLILCDFCVLLRPIPVWLRLCRAKCFAVPSSFYIGMISAAFCRKPLRL